MKSTQSNYFPPDHGMELVRMGKYAFHAEDSTAYKIIHDTFDEKLICKLSEIEMFPPVGAILLKISI
jgi:glutamate receptor, ionotropic, invertebrate